MIAQIFHNGLCWLILLVALIGYQQLWLQWLNVRDNRLQEEAFSLGGRAQSDFAGVLIGALPLLGLLGTISGLLECFAGMAVDGSGSEQMSAGIASALVSTQLGLVCAVPGWLLQAYVRSAPQPRDAQPLDSAARSR